MTEQERAEMVEYVVANCGYCDEATVNDWDDEHLRGQAELLQTVENQAEEIEELTANQKEPKAKPPVKDPVANVTAKPKSEEEWLADAPEDVVADLQFARNERARQAAAKIEEIIENTGRESDKEFIDFLKTKSAEDLDQFAKLTPPARRRVEAAPVTNFFGQGAVPGSKGKLKPKPLPSNREYEHEMSQAGV